MRSLTVALLLSGILAGSALADVVVLTDGSKREGKIVKQDKDEVVLEIAQGRLKAQIILKRSEIKSIEKGETANQKLVKEVAGRRKKLKAGDKAGWLEFAQWLEKQNGFSKDARTAYEKVVALDKDNEIARRKLGYRKVAGQWLTQDEIMLAKGYVKHSGKWVTPEQKTKLAAADEKKLENVKIALAEEVKKNKLDKKVDADVAARQKWLKDMRALAAEKAARYQQGGIIAAPASGGVVLGRYGYGYYRVRTASGEYIPYVPANQPAVYYTGTGFSTYPYATTVSRRRYVSSGINWGVRYTDKHLDVRAGSRGTRIIYTIKK
jgi:hypothetical protein